MKYSRMKYLGLIALGMMWLQGCASVPGPDENTPVVDDLSSENLDLLFATEFPVASKDEALMKAASAYRDGKFDEAQFYLIGALKFDRADTEVLAQIGNLHARQGNLVLAARAFQFALHQDPGHAVSLEGLGLLYFKAGNDDEARKHLERAVASAPELWRSFNTLGVIADNQKEFELAESYYDTALEIQPLADSVLINRGYSRYLSGDYHEAALDFYTVAQRGNSEKAWLNLAMVYAKQGWYEDALETFLRIGKESYAYNEIGVIAMSNGDTEEALHYLTEAVRVSPTYFAQAEKNLAELRKKDQSIYRDSTSYVN